jgi:hypothetical protein
MGRTEKQQLDGMTEQDVQETWRSDIGFQPHGNVFFHTRNAVVDKQTSLAVQVSNHVVLSVASSMKDWYFDTQSEKVVVPPYLHLLRKVRLMK